jgi:hypothetical protein
MLADTGDCTSSAIPRGYYTAGRRQNLVMLVQRNKPGFSGRPLRRMVIQTGHHMTDVREYIMSEPTPESLNPSDALNEMGTLFRGAASGLNWLFWLWEPGQGWRFVLGVGGVASGVAAAKLYTSPSVSQEKSSAFPAAILLTGLSFICLYMTMRSWPVNSEGQAIRPAAYAVMILRGQKPPAGPPPPDNTSAIQGGLEAIAAIWIVNKAASSISSVAGAAGVLGGIWAAIKGLFGTGSGAAGEPIPEVPVESLTIPAVPGLGSGPSGTGIELV